MDDLTWILIAIVSLAVAGYLALIASAIVSVIRSAELALVSRAAWLAAIIAFPVLGTIAWYGIGYRTHEVERALGIRPV
ncbi:PLDc N-terminal domain-containing protein [Plantibacter sp. Mn2098]|uniref:PLDc N-terminal domain-containing protein n=1 Tax=Plantibacter sp. Mn2098 TaxID=3395266 RepID=UPI003BCC43DD